ncbi:MAG: hypothetical protein FD157_146 [Rhodocyclaceae bacterium]|nr:MAG: hypothetical protein FD157_146 [Rhodocyclaceae bacterium]TND03303.1 MAG: hypothetical protein FD118_1463 [Rhodocyclaceae bacterium]
MADLQEVYARTEAGVAEIKARALDLTRGQRNLLIVIDGKNALGSFAKMAGCAPEQMGDVLLPLIEHGLIARVAGRSNWAPEQNSPAGGRPSPSTYAGAQVLIALAERVFEKHAGPVVLKLEKAAGSGGDLLAAAESAAKLAKLTIDESKAQEFLVEARRLISG